MPKKCLLLATLLFAPLLARAQVELVYKTPTETLLVTGVQGMMPLHQSAGQSVPVHGDGQLEIRPAKAFSPVQATISPSYSLRRAPRTADDAGRLMLTCELLFETDDSLELQNGLYVACVWEVAGRPARVFVRGAVSDSRKKVLFEDTIPLKPEEEDGFLRVYFFRDGKSIAGLTKRDVKPGTALADFVALKSAIDAGSRQDVVAWAARNPTLAVPGRLLSQLVQWGDAPALDAILTQTASRRNLAGEDGADVLMAAVRSNRAETAALILKCGVKASQPGTNKIMPMQQATAINSPDMVRQLLRAGATVGDQTYKNDDTPLSLAVKQGSAEAVEALLAEGAQWPKAKRILTKWLITSVEQRCAANVSRLLAQGADANASKGDYMPYGTPLLVLAALGNNVEVVDALLKAGAKPDAGNEDKVTALMVSAYAGNQVVTERLLAAGAKLAQLDKDNQSAAVWALVGGNEALARWLLGKYSPSKAELSSLLKLALLNEKGPLADELRAKGARLDLADKQIDDVICDAIRRGDAATVSEALAGGYNANKQIKPEWTVGGVAQRYGQGEILAALKTAAGGKLAVTVPVVFNLPVRLTFRPPDSTPEEMQAAGIYGEAKIDLMIDAEGNPAFPRILPGCDPQLGRHALASVMQWVFDPLENNGKGWRRVIVPLNYARPDPADRGARHIYYPWELDQPVIPIDRKAESWSFVRTQPVELVAAAFIVNRQGDIVNPRIASSSAPAAKAPALDLVRQWKYQPGIKEGKLVWSYEDDYLVMPQGRRIQPKLLFPIDDLPPGAVIPRVLQEGWVKDYSVEHKMLYFGIALLRFTVGADGKVRTVSTLASSSARVAQYAQNVCQSAVYAPGKIDGKPVAMEVIRCLSFVDYDTTQGQVWNEN